MRITREQKKLIGKIGRKYKLRFVIVHGSYARGEERKGSDLDVAVYGKKKIEFDALMKMHGDFGKIFGDNKERELDLKEISRTDPLFFYQVVRDGELIYGDKHDYSAFEAFAFRNYFYNVKIFKLEDILIKSALQNL